MGRSFLIVVIGHAAAGKATPRAPARRQTRRDLARDSTTLLERARRCAAQPGVHGIKARFSVRPERSEQQYQPVLDPSRVVSPDTTDLDAVHLTDVAPTFQGLLS
jgi:hypothetical protein